MNDEPKIEFGVVDGGGTLIWDESTESMSGPTMKGGATMNNAIPCGVQIHPTPKIPSK